MFFNPVCHWAGGATPLFTYAPGDMLGVDKVNNQEPEPTIFYNTVAALAGVGVPAPTALWPLEDSSSPLVDVATLGADLVGAGNYLVQVRNPCYWDPVNKNFRGYYKRGVQVDAAQTTSYFACANASLGDIAAGDDFFFVIHMRPSDLGAYPNVILNKGITGWYIDRNGAEFRFYTGSPSMSPRNCAATVWVQYSSPVVLAGYVDRSTNLMRLWCNCSGWGSTVDISLSAGETIGSANPIAMCGGNSYRSPYGVIVWAGLWYGANATDMITNWDATYRPILSPVYPAGNRSPETLYNYLDNGANVAEIGPAVVDEDPATGLVGANFAANRVASNDRLDFPWRYDPSISRASKYTARTNNYRSLGNYLGNSEYYDTWTRSNLTATYTWADLIERPDGWKRAYRCTATADNAYMEGAFGVPAAGTSCVYDICVRRAASMGSDVTGKLVAWNATAGSILAQQAFTATDKWQRVKLEFTGPGGATITYRVYIDNNTDAINACWATALYQVGFQDSFIERHSGNGYSVAAPFSHQAASADDLMFSDRGEIEIRCRRFSAAAELYAQYICCVQSTSTVGGNNSRLIWVDTSNQVNASIYNNVGGLVCTVNSAPIDMTSEKLIRLRWNIAGLPSGNTAELIVDGTTYAMSVASWAVSQTAIYLVVSGLGILDTATGFNGSVSYAKIWAEPR